MEDKLIGALSLSRKAGALQIGFDSVSDALSSGTAILCFYAKDVSKQTLRRLTTRNVRNVSMIQLPYAQEELAFVTGKPAGVLSINNRDLAALCKHALGNKEERV